MTETFPRGADVSHRVALLLVTLLVLAACGVTPESDNSGSSDGDAGGTDSGGSPADGATATDATADAGLSPAESKAAAALFDPNSMVVVDIQMPAAEWDKLRKENRNLDNFLLPNCRKEPFFGTFTYRKATVSINGVKRDDVGVRKKGFVGSIDPNKPSLKLKFNKFKEGQLLHGTERMTLNNNRQDPAFVRTCLAYALFAKAGLPTPRCNFAQVSVNGTNLGLFSHVENVKKRFLSREFGDKSGHLYEGTLSDFRDGWTATLEAKTNKTDKAHPIIDKLTQALKLPDDKLLAGVGKLLDLPEFIDFWALEVLVNHFDGYNGNTNNFFVYLNPKDNKLHFIPWGTDATFRVGKFGAKAGLTDVLARSSLARRLYLHKKGQEMYIKALNKVLDDVWDEQNLAAELKRLRTLLEKVADQDPMAKARGTVFADQLAAVGTWITSRRAVLQSVTKNPPTWTQAEPEMICFKLSVKASGTFATTFGTMAAKDPFSAGSGTISGTSEEGPFKVDTCGAKSGYAKDKPHMAEVQLIFQHPANKALFIIVALPVHKDEFKAGAKITLELFIGGRGGAMAAFNTATQQVSKIAGVWKGTLTLDKAGLTPGDAVVGSFNVEMVAVGK